MSRHVPASDAHASSSAEFATTSSYKRNVPSSRRRRAGRVRRDAPAPPNFCVKIRIQRTRLAQAPSSSARSPPSVCAATSSSSPQLGGKYEREAPPPPPFIPVCLKPPARTPHRARPPRRSRTSALPLLPRRHARRDSPAAARPPRPNNFQLPRHRRASVPTAADLSLACRSRSPRSPARTEPHQHPPPSPPPTCALRQPDRGSTAST